MSASFRCPGSFTSSELFSKSPGRYRVWHFLTRLNERHPMFAWLSLFSVGLTDLYIRLVSMGIVRDWRII